MFCVTLALYTLFTPSVLYITASQNIMFLKGLNLYVILRMNFAFIKIKV
jgi:hypothetical protein